MGSLQRPLNLLPVVNVFGDFSHLQTELHLKLQTVSVQRYVVAQSLLHLRSDPELRGNPSDAVLFDGVSDKTNLHCSLLLVSESLFIVGKEGKALEGRVLPEALGSVNNAEVPGVALLHVVSVALAFEEGNSDPENEVSQSGLNFNELFVGRVGYHFESEVGVEGLVDSKVFAERKVLESMGFYLLVLSYL